MKTSLRLARTADGRRLEVSRPIEAPRERVWDLFVDTRQWPRWGPSITDVRATERRIREGTTGQVRTVAGQWLDFTVTACSEFRWTWRVAGIPATGHRVEALSDGCRAVFEIFLIAALYAPVCARALSNLGRIA